MRAVLALLLCTLPLAALHGEGNPAGQSGDVTLSMVVMDPLAEPLSCPCVQGYAQRKYERLAEYLQAKLGRPVQVTFAESFEKALAKESCKHIDIAIGKDSVVRADAAKAKLKVTPVARLTGQDGKTTQTGLIVVRSADVAQQLEDLHGYRIIFGPRECDEKFAAPRKMLAAAHIELPTVEASEVSESCSDGACKIIEWGDSQRAAAVISSYAAPLLQGCGTVKKGDLRVVAETAPVPFITAFTTNRVDSKLQQQVQNALLEVHSNVDLKSALESLLGFVEIDDEYHSLRKSLTPDAAKTDPVIGRSATPSKPSAGSPAANDSSSTNTWPQWRGPNRDGYAAQLPRSLPDKPHIVWRKSLRRPGLGGVAATEKYVLLGDRDLTNNFDEFRCYAADTGEVLWSVQYPALGKLDFDNTPRATPLIAGNKAYLFGAFGDLTCVELEAGLTVWRTNVIAQFDGEKELVWGTCSSPLICDGKLIVNPGGNEASIVALDPETGGTIWETPGARHAHASFIAATLGGVRQLVGYDQKSLGGWDIATGRRLWTLKPPHDGDFNVPTPIAVDGMLVVTTENNFTRLYAFDDHGLIIPRPQATNEELGPDMSTPIAVGNRLFCVHDHMYCLDLANRLKPIWIGDDDSFGNYSPLIASNDRVLAFGRGGELILVDALAAEFRIVSRLQLFEDRESREARLLSQPALVNTRLYLRGEKELICAELQPAAN
ncbi:MAG: PhnD/SsuA/transferrin family substrate-binding protein [Pirellulales bacterium]